MATFKYRVLRVCYWNEILWNPEVKGEVIIDPETAGVPPHHFEPLDGGPVQGKPEKANNPEIPAPSAVELPPVPNTYAELGKAAAAEEDKLLESRMAADAPGGRKKKGG